LCCDNSLDRLTYLEARDAHHSHPLIIEISKGDADVNIVAKDILTLTKLNYNTSIVGEGMTITLNSQMR
jgi:hypothetical protein